MHAVHARGARYASLLATVARVRSTRARLGAEFSRDVVRRDATLRNRKRRGRRRERASEREREREREREGERGRRKDSNFD